MGDVSKFCTQMGEASTMYLMNVLHFIFLFLVKLLHGLHYHLLVLLFHGLS
jgi:hypothetical protein